MKGFHVDRGRRRHKGRAGGIWKHRSVCAEGMGKREWRRRLGIGGSLFAGGRQEVAVMGKNLIGGLSRWGVVTRSFWGISIGLERAFTFSFSVCRLAKHHER